MGCQCPLSASVDSDLLEMGQFYIFLLVVERSSIDMSTVGYSLYVREFLLVYTGGVF